MKRRWDRMHPRLPAGTVALLILAGCAVGPDHARPPLRVEMPDAYVAAGAPGDPRGTASESVAPAWWTAFGDTTLSQLVVEAVARNQDLRRAAARVLEARALLGGAESDRWPRIEVGGSASRSKSSRAPFGGVGTMYREYFDANLTARYELDLWGRLSRAEEAAAATLLQSELNRRVVRQTLIADVVRAWLLVRELQCQLDLTHHTIASYRQTVALVEERYVRGTVPSLEVHLARQNLLSAQAAEPEQRRQLAEAVRRLEILAGRYPAGVVGRLAAVQGGDRSAPAPPTMPPPLPPVPAGLPSSLLERRPDLLAAEAGLHAATASVGAVKARLYPTINLTGSGGYVSGDLKTWFDKGTDVWSLAAGLAMPLVNRGATKAQVRAAEARAEQAAAGYQQAVFVALSEVENALEAERLQAERELALAEAVAEAQRTAELAEQRYRSGLDGLLTTLEAQRRLLASTGALLSTQRAHRTARVNLILALGGHWDGEAYSPDLAAGSRSAPPTTARQGDTSRGDRE